MGADHLASYRFNAGTADRLFRRACGIKSFHVPRSNPDGYGVNVRCLGPPPARLTARPLDGRDRERQGPSLAGPSEDG